MDEVRQPAHALVPLPGHIVGDEAGDVADEKSEDHRRSNRKYMEVEEVLKLPDVF